MDAIVENFQAYEEAKNWADVFVQLQERTETQTEDLKYTYHVANKGSNQPKNRYCNILPYDQNRITLGPKNEYINASPMHSDIVNRDYIFTQGPLPHTSADFWQMVWEQGSSIVVNLTKSVEKGQIKCHPYFPASDESKTKKFGNYVVELLEERRDISYTVRKLKLSPKKSEPRIIHHFQFTAWPDFNVPDESTHFMEFVEAVRDLDESIDDKAPIVCHCSAGIGRSGTFAVADIILTALRSGNTALPLIDDLILDMRRARMYLVQTPLQLRFAWQTVVEWIQKHKDDALVAKKKNPSEGESTANGTSANDLPGNSTGDADDEKESAPLVSRKRHSTDENISLRKSADGSKRSRT